MGRRFRSADIQDLARTAGNWVLGKWPMQIADWSMQCPADVTVCCGPTVIPKEPKATEGSLVPE